MLVADTTYVIDLLKNDAGALAIYDETQEYAICEMTRYEVLKGEYFFGNKKQNIKANELLQAFSIMPTTIGTSKRSAKIMADLMRKGKPIGNEDCIIAGTALSYGIKKIITRNKKHFENIPEIEVVEY